MEILAEMGMEDMNIIVHGIIEKIIINGSGEVEVMGNLSEFSKKVEYVTKNRNSWVAKRREVDVI